MSRLPTPGGDAAQWGAILNDFLLQQHNADGSHKLSLLLQLPPSSGLSLVSDTSMSSGFGWTAITKAMVGLSNVTNDAQVKLSDIDTDGLLAANSDVAIASQKAVKTYVDTNMASKINARDALALSVAL